MKRIDNLWNLLKKYWWLFLVIVLLLVILDSLIRGLDWSNWAEPGPGAITLWGRSLWDWAGLLLVPLVLAFGGFLFQRSERKTDREIADKRHETDQQIAKEARMDKTLDEYLKAMTSFLLQENSLLKSKNGDPIREVARTQTITVIKRLDSERNQIVFQFLQEADLISTMKEDMTKKVKKPFISLAKTDLSGVDLSGADLLGVNMRDANLQGANLQEADLQYANLEIAYLQNANLQKAVLANANLKFAILQEVDLSLALLRDANLQRAHLQKANLSLADLQEADLPHADLQEANLQGAHLSLAILQEANLQGADLQEADLQGALLEGANLQGANLQGADLRAAHLEGANLQGALFLDIYPMKDGESLEGTTMPDGTIFSETTDLKKFTGPTEEE